MNTSQKLLSLLTPTQRRLAIVLFVLMLIGMLLETLGIGLVIPVLVLMTQNDLTAKYPALEPILNSLGNPTHVQLVVGAMFVMVGVYTIKVLFLAFLAWRQMSFIFLLHSDISQRLFVGYLRQPYTFHLQRNSAQIIHNIITDVTLLIGYGLKPALLLLTEISVLLGISFVLLSVEPVGAVMVLGALGLAGWSFHRFTKQRILNWGKARKLHEGLRLQHLQQGLGGVKDVKLLGREEDFIHQFQLHSISSARVNEHQSTLQSFPRLFLEILAVLGIVVLVLIMIIQGKSLDALLPTLGVFVVAAFRLMPIVSRVLNAVQQMRYSLPVIDTLYSELLLLKDAQAPQHGSLLPFHNSLKLEDIYFQYPASETQALRGISLTISRGTSVGFIGGSGAGKSTLVDIILGLLTPDEGTVRVDGTDIKTNLRGWQDQIGYVPQSIFLTDDTLRRNVAFGLPNEQIDEAAVCRAIQAAQLESFVKELPQGLDTIVGERGIRLSGGQRQRIGIARALYHEPSVLVMDEATSSLDTYTERGVMKAVDEQHGKKTIIIVAHRLSTVERCDRLFRLEKGHLIEEGDTAEILGKIVRTT